MTKGKSFFAGSRRGVALAFLLGVLLVAAAWSIGIAAGPFEADPDYMYLLNGLRILSLHAPVYHDHPGTPLEVLAAFTIALAWLAAAPWHGFSSIFDQVLKFPGFYLGAINIVLVAGIVAAAIFFACRIWRAGGRLFPALVGSLTIFLSAAAFLAAHRVTPEPVLLAGGLVLAGLLAPLAFSQTPVRETKKLAVLTGAAIGFCIATKVTAGPLLILIFLLRAPAARKVALAACVLTLVVLTLPVMADYREIAAWYVNLATHRGSYGSGAVGAPGLSELGGNVVILAREMPEVFVCLAVYLAVLLAQLSGVLRPPPSAMRVLAFCFVFITVDLLLVLKQPAARYTIPVVPFLCLGNAIVAQFLLGAKAWSRVALVILMAVLALSQGAARTEQLAMLRRDGQALLREARQSECLPAFYYGAPDVQFELFFGDGWAGKLFRGRLARLYPDFVSFDVGPGGFERFSGPLTEASARALFAGQKCVFLIGSPAERFGSFGLSPDSFSPMARSTGELWEAVAIYALKPQWRGDKAP